MRSLPLQARLRGERWQAWLLFTLCYLFLLAIVTFGQGSVPTAAGNMAGLASPLPVGETRASAMR